MKTFCLLSITVLLALLFLPTFPLAASEDATVYVTFWFDTEDFILPQADDAAKRLAEMFSQRDVRATFKIVGEKAKVLAERGRDDVILALAKHDIAYHSTDHSVHPTPSEYSRDLDWHEGVSEFIRREEPGLRTLQRVFGVNASCYGQPGGSWTPQSYAALNAFQIPVYLDDTSHVNLNNRPFRYCGVLTILELGDAVMRTGWTDEAVERACAKFDRVSEELAREGGGIISIYYHPCEFVHREFWDGVNFSRGANPPRSEWKLPPMKSPAEQEQAFKAFGTYLDHIVDRAGVQLVTARELSSQYPDRAYTHPLTRRDVHTIAQVFQKRLSYVDLGPRIVSAAEGLLALSQFVAGTDGDGSPDQVETQFAYGPTSRAQRFITEGTFSWSAIRKAAQELNDAVRQSEQLPSVVWVAGQPLRPEDFAVTLASVVASKRDSQDISMRQGQLEAEKYVADNAPRLWGWVIFPEDFDAPRMMEIAKLQAWTIKPAVLRKKN
jgi:peptidoglycan/xylan/chitin deacetylase (PgdA/CDA1 family)